MMKYFNWLFKSRSFEWGGIVHHLFDTVASQCINVTCPGHPINDHHQMSKIDVGAIERKDCVNLFQECRPCRFNAVAGPNGKDVVALGPCMVNGLQLVEKVQVDAFCVDNKLLPLCPDADFGNVLGTFDGGIQYHFDIFEKVLFGPHIQMDIIDQVIVVGYNDIFPNCSHPRYNIVQGNIVLHNFFPTQQTVQHLFGRVTHIPPVVVRALQVVQQLWGLDTGIGLFRHQMFDAGLLDLCFNFPGLFWSQIGLRKHCQTRCFNFFRGIDELLKTRHSQRHVLGTVTGIVKGIPVKWWCVWGDGKKKCQCWSAFVQMSSTQLTMSFVSWAHPLTEPQWSQPFPRVPRWI